MSIRRYRDSDHEAVFRLYREQTADLSFHHHVRRDQFARDLLTSRFLRDPEDHHAKAKIALVAVKDKRVIAFVSGGIVTNGDVVIPAKTGYVQAIIASPDAAEEVKRLVERVVAHLRPFRPKKIVAQDACLCPVFFGDSASCLPTTWAWIGQCLLDSGFEVSARSLRLVATLEQPRGDAEPPDDLKFLHITHEMKGFLPKYDFGCLLMKPPYEHGDAVVWCGNFYSGIFVKGTAYRSLYMNWFTVVDEGDRRKGFGRLVLRHCLDEAQKRGAKFASLLTDIDNFVAQSLYLSEGFEVVDTMHSFQWRGK